MMATAVLVAAPMLWLAALQTGYTMAYQACDTGSRHWVTVPVVLALAATVVTAVGAGWALGRTVQSPPPAPMLARLSVGTAALMVIVLMASALAPFMLRPCD
jgi:hypothetical protein